MESPRKATPDPDAILAFLGLNEDFSDLGPEDISSIPQDQWVDCTELVPPPAIQRYLNSGDSLTNHTIEMMEAAMERALGVKEPWFVTCIREGDEENGTLAVSRFVLIRGAS